MPPSSFTLTDPKTVDTYESTNDTALVPVNAIAQHSANTIHTIPLLVSFDTMTDGTDRTMFNNITYNMLVVRSVFSAISLDADVGPNAAGVAGAYGPWNHVLEAGDVVDIVLMNSDAGKHPL